jgi:hypothetical protein
VEHCIPAVTAIGQQLKDLDQSRRDTNSKTSIGTTIRTETIIGVATRIKTRV